MWARAREVRVPVQVCLYIPWAAVGTCHALWEPWESKVTLEFCCPFKASSLVPWLCSLG